MCKTVEIHEATMELLWPRIQHTACEPEIKKPPSESNWTLNLEFSCSLCHSCFLIATRLKTECGMWIQETPCLHERASSRKSAKVAERGYNLPFVFQVSGQFICFSAISFAIKPLPENQPLHYGKVECLSTISNTVRVIGVRFWACLPQGFVCSWY